MPKRCTVEAHPRLGEVNVALHAHVSWREIERQFGIPKDTVGRHARQCLGLSSPDPKTARNGRRRAQRAIAGAVSRAEAAPIETPADVLRELTFLYAEATQLYERAKVSNDTRLMERALAQRGAILDRFAKSFGMYGDGAVAILDHSTKVLNVLGQIPEAEMRALLARADAGETIDLEAARA